MWHLPLVYLLIGFHALVTAPAIRQWWVVEGRGTAADVRELVLSAEIEATESVLDRLLELEFGPVGETVIDGGIAISSVHATVFAGPPADEDCLAWNSALSAMAPAPCGHSYGAGNYIVGSGSSETPLWSTLTLPNATLDVEPLGGDLQ